MPAISPDNMARSAMLARLADTATGFNPNYLLARANYPTAPAMTVDFSTTSKGLILGQISAAQAVASSTVTFPLVTIYAKAGANRNQQKFQRFAGPVRCYLNFHLSDGIFKSARAINDFETWGDAVIASVLETMNGPTVQGAWTQNVVYNGEIGWERSPIAEGSSSNWLQTVSFLSTFEVIVS